MQLKQIIFLIALAMPFLPLQAQVIVDVRNPNQGSNTVELAMTPMELVLKRDDKECDVRTFICACGNATVQTVTDARKVQYAVLRYADGWDKLTRSEFLSIYRVGERLSLVAIIPVSGQAGVESRWKYQCKILKPKAGGLLLSLTLELEGNDASRAPEESIATITLN